MGVSSSSWGYPNSWMVNNGKSPSKMDDEQGYPYFRKPPYLCSGFEHGFEHGSNVMIIVITDALSW